MKTQISITKPLLIFILSIFILLVLLTTIHGQHNLNNFTRLSETKTAFDSQIRRSLNERVQLQQMREEIRSCLTPEILAQKFVEEFRRASSKRGLAGTEKHLQEYLAGKAKQAVGGISGNFTIPTEYLRKGITVLAFDSYGYISGVGQTNFYDLTYAIENLEPGDYYIMTVSREYAYVDELYNNITAPVFSREAWRDAQKVSVSAGITTENIDFDLQPSQEFLFTLYNSDGVNVSSEDEATFTLTRNDRPEILLEDYYEYNYTDGEFEFFIPFTGDFKLGVTPEYMPTTWYKNSNNWQDADKLSIPSFTNTIDSLDIILTQAAPSTEVGKISGIVTGNGEFKMIFAFKADDLSLENIAFIFYSSYRIEDLPPGEYYVYAEDYLGNIAADDMLGTFYENAATVAEAQKVTVEAGQTTYGINITLRQGAAITGKLTDQDATPLADMLVVALNMDLPEASAFNLFTQMHFGVGKTDSSGNYRIAGLATGEYVVRTLSDYTIGIFWGFPSLEDGPHKGKVVDEFYQGVYNLFDFGDAQKIAVTDTFTVDNVDFALQKAKFFKGHLSDAATSKSINQALMVAFTDSGFPFYNLPKIDYYGDYELGPLPSGTYKLLAAANHDPKDFYLPEYYENATALEDAMPLVLINDDLENIDFEFEKAAIIRGHVNLADGAGQAGDDTLSNFPVVLFDATDGSFARNAYVQFDGGFRLPRLLPGSYKLVALPVESPFAATYYGGGNSFDDSKSHTIQINSGEILDVNIELERAGSTITGNVTSQANGESVANCLVIAYDGTGHAIGIGVTNEYTNEIVEEQPTGDYKITGLRANDYYLCTYAFTDESEIAIKVPQYLMADDADLFEMVLGLLETLLASDMNLYADSWYDRVHLRTEFDIPELVASFLIYGMANEYDNARYPFYMPIPFQREIPAAASLLNVPENTTIPNIDFQLTVDSMEDILLEVKTDNPNDGLPDDLALYPNYPNPFNSSTNIYINLPGQSKVNVSLYNILGERVISLADDLQLPRGQHKMQWSGTVTNGQEAPTGLYFVVLEVGDVRRVAKLTLLR